MKKSKLDDSNNTATIIGQCDICGDSMLKAVLAKILISNLASKPMRREV
jgi:hypothetical protein